jgi:uncharacterized protein
MIHNKYFEIMKEFLGDYNKEIYGRELIGKVKLSQKNIALTLNELEELGILFSKLRGNMRYYSLNKKNSLGDMYLLLFEVEKNIDFMENHLKIKNLFEEVDLLGIVCIFGSYAKGLEKKDSDLDLFIVGNCDEKKLEEIGKKFGIEVSVKSGSKKDFREMLKTKNPLIREIVESHIIVSGFEDFVNEVLKNG